ncbi:MAG: tRNA pseudouridine(38-40) synthase TruA [Chloroherpetonaceae bacterium]|nr:tRNA pseudouridine(38-40) synthase TruA [Chloroherpetonaceae bacterium]MDW8438451.1 tRNA pseudouridine(38-40) synthase TruA [Chloroherpetonaceae bacterium]
MRNLKLLIEYDGTDYAGWQRQPQNPHQRAIQAELEKLFSQLLREPVEITGAGRTDAGVHAVGQVANFITKNDSFPLEKLRYACSRMLPKGIVVKRVEEAPLDFNARFDALSRTYRYFIITEPSAIKQRFATYVNPRLYGVHRFDVDAMREASETLLGEHDFTSYSKVGARKRSPICEVKSVRWVERRGQLMFEIAADRFLHSMVRLIVGTLLEVGGKKRSVAEFAEVLKARNVDCAGAVAPPEGLFLWSVQYPNPKEHA